MIPNHIQAPQARQAHAAGDAVILDVREPGEWASARIPGAVHIPLADLPYRFRELPKDKTIVCQCASGGRSVSAAGFLAQQGYKAANLVGGIMDWHRHGLPLER